MRKQKGIEPADELKQIEEKIADNNEKLAEVQESIAEDRGQLQVAEESATVIAQRLLANDAQVRANECAQRCAQICQELRCTPAARTIAYGNQSITEIIYVAN